MCTAATYQGKNYYFARGIMKCPVCGHSYIGYKHGALYVCVAYRHDNKDIEKCHNNVSINFFAKMRTRQFLTTRIQSVANHLDFIKRQKNTKRTH